MEEGQIITDQGATHPIRSLVFGIVSIVLGVENLVFNIVSIAFYGCVIAYNDGTLQSSQPVGTNDIEALRITGIALSVAGVICAIIGLVFGLLGRNYGAACSVDDGKAKAGKITGLIGFIVNIVTAVFCLLFAVLLSTVVVK
jgi:hypothetical protein